MDIRHGYACTFNGCQVVFDRRQNCIDHMRIHASERPFVCGVVGCPASFAHRNQIREHQMLVHGDDRRFACTCNGCQLVFASRRALMVHMRIHAYYLPFLCRIDGCPASFRHRSQMWEHYIYIHSDEWPSLCTVCTALHGCPSAFIGPHDLRDHMRTHH